MLRAGSLGRLLNGELKTFKLPREDARPYSVAVDRDGNVWYADPRLCRHAARPLRSAVGVSPAGTPADWWLEDEHHAHAED
jgi:hypothetical protein